MMALRLRHLVPVALAVLTVVAGVHWAAPELRWADLWRTRDQQGSDAFARGDFARAAERFADSRWRGAACYRAGDTGCALEAWASFDDADAEYNLGNTTLRAGWFDAALAHYDRALRLHAGWPKAMDNRALALRLKDEAEAARRDKNRRRPGDKGDDDGAPDTRIDEKSREGKPGEVRVQKLGPGDIDALWLRNLQTDPAVFLRRRFAAEVEAVPKPVPVVSGPASREAAARSGK